MPFDRKETQDFLGEIRLEFEKIPCTVSGMESFIKKMKNLDPENVYHDYVYYDGPELRIYGIRWETGKEFEARVNARKRLGFDS